MSTLTKHEINTYKKSWNRIDEIVKTRGLNIFPPQIQRMYERIITISKKRDVENWRVSGFYSDLGEVYSKIFGNGTNSNKAYFVTDSIVMAICNKWELDIKIIEDVFNFYADV